MMTAPATALSPSDKRRHVRIPVVLLVQHRSAEGAEDFDYASDLSKSGIFIQTQRPMSVGATLQLSFHPRRDARMVQAYCRVARVTAEGVAAEFVQLDETSSDLLGTALPH